jgi:hypothetical protein
VNCHEKNSRVKTKTDLKIESNIIALLDIAFKNKLNMNVFLYNRSPKYQGVAVVHW